MTAIPEKDQIDYRVERAHAILDVYAGFSQIDELAQHVFSLADQLRKALDNIRLLQTVELHIDIDIKEK